ncbi:hypothetical protein PRNP1_014269 [Phytophthora ramorum]
MASKLEYLQRYMSSSGGDAESDKKRKKKVKKTKKTKSAAQGTRVVDADDAWEQSAPSREDIEKKWEQDATEDEQPLVVAADGEQLEDPQDLPVYVDSDKYLDGFRGKKKQKEDGDLSPPRKKKSGGPRGRDNSEDKSPPRRPKRERLSNVATESEGQGGDSGEVVSPPRKQRRGRDGDVSSPRRDGQDDASPPRRRAMKSSTSRGLRGDDVNASPPRRGRDQSRDASRLAADSAPDQKPTNEPSKRDDKNLKKESVKADGKEEKKAGLFTATEFEAQRKVAARRKDVLHGVDASEMGANAETVYRDKRGRKLDMLNEMVRQQEVLDGKRKREEREEYEWGTGEVQKRERMSKQELIEQMKKTPFARHEDDEELERKRRDRVRAFDPINSKTFREDPLAEEGKGKKQKSKKDRKKTSQAKPKYAGPPAPPNRFGIMPGYRWDGVVRGTNWEEKIMMRQNANTAVSEEAYKYAVADM